MNPHRTTRTAWILVTAVIAAAVLLGVAIIVGNTVLLIVAAAVVVVVGLGAATLARRAGGVISFSEEFPENTIGPRATTGGDSRPPVNTQRHPDPTPAAPAIREVATPEAPDPPDDGRVFPQYVNLAPGERLRRVHGEVYIEKEPEAGSDEEERS